MTTDPSAPRADEGPAETGPSRAASSEVGSAEASPSQPQRPRRFTRASAAWVATSVALLLLVLLIVFMLQNTTKVEVHFLGLSGSIPLGTALLIAAVGGGVVVAIAGIGRVTQLRINARRTRKNASAN